MGNLALAGATSGTITLTPAAVAGTTTITLPATTGTVALTASPTFSGTVTATTVTSPASTALTIQSAGTTAMTVDTSQNVGIGTTSPGAKLDISAASNNAVARIISTDSTRCDLRFQTSGSNSGIYFGNSTTFDIGRIYYDNSGNNMVFFTNSSERMRIDSSGNLLVGTTSAVNGAKMAINSGTARALELVITTTANSLVQAFDNPNGTVGGIYTNGTATSYSTSSDYRLKNDIQPIDNGLATVSALKPVSYKWNTDRSYGEGFIAHELQNVIPLAVNGDKDAVDDEDNPLYQAVDYSKIVVHLVAAIQELSAKNDALEARLASLEAK